MEVYFKDLISEENSLEKLVDDLALVVHGADDFANAVEAGLSEQSRERMVDRLARLKRSYHRLKSNALAGARATDKAVRANPYSFMAGAVLVGLLVGVGVRWRKR